MENTIRGHLHRFCKENTDVYEYALFPAGKLFRPRLAEAIFYDIGGPLQSKKLELLISALEFHHVYSLLHDDLPAMDNDTYRRGRLCTHKKFSEWQAILCGDGLLNMSYECIAQIGSIEMIKIFSRAMGARGLILGQELDLSLKMNESVELLLKTHELKTARLIQCATTLPTFLLPHVKMKKDFWRLGYNIGIVFQLLDDFDDAKEIDAASPEALKNPWIRQSEYCRKVLIKNINSMQQLLEKHQLIKTFAFLKSYLENTPLYYEFKIDTFHK